MFFKYSKKDKLPFKWPRQNYYNINFNILINNFHILYFWVFSIENNKSVVKRLKYHLVMHFINTKLLYHWFIIQPSFCLYHST